MSFIHLFIQRMLIKLLLHMPDIELGLKPEVKHILCLQVAYGLLDIISGWSFVLEDPRWPPGKESVCNADTAGNAGLIPGLGRSPGGGSGNPLQYSCLGNPMDRGAWQAAVHPWGRKESDRTEWLITHKYVWGTYHQTYLVTIYHYACIIKRS